MRPFPILLILSLLLSGCATTGQINPDTLNTYVTSHASVLTKAASVASTFAISLAEKDPFARAELREDIQQVVEKVSRGLDVAASAAGGTLTPSQLADDLKVRDANVQAFLDAVVVLYRDGYEKLEKSGKADQSIAWAKLVLNSMKILSDGLNKATK